MALVEELVKLPYRSYPNAVPLSAIVASLVSKLKGSVGTTPAVQSETARLAPSYTTNSAMLHQTLRRSDSMWVSACWDV